MSRREDAEGLFWKDIVSGMSLQPEELKKPEEPEEPAGEKIKVEKEYVKKFREGYASALCDVERAIWPRNSETPLAPITGITEPTFIKWKEKALAWINSSIPDETEYLCDLYDWSRPSYTRLKTQRIVNGLHSHFIHLQHDIQIGKVNVKEGEALLTSIKQELEIAIDNMKDEIRIEREEFDRELEKAKLISRELHGENKL